MSKNPPGILPIGTRVRRLIKGEDCGWTGVVVEHVAGADNNGRSRPAMRIADDSAAPGDYAYAYLGNEGIVAL